MQRQTAYTMEKKKTKVTGILKKSASLWRPSCLIERTIFGDEDDSGDEDGEATIPLNIQVVHNPFYVLGIVIVLSNLVKPNVISINTD